MVNEKTDKYDEKEYYQPLCEDCGSADAKFTECPFNAEINHDYTKVWLCEDCQSQRAWDI